MKNFAIKLSGPAGAGMMQAGETLSKALNLLGYYTLMYPEYPSRIRGGDNHVLIVFSDQNNLSPTEKINLLLAFGKQNFEEHKKEAGENFFGFEAQEIGLLKIGQELGNSLVANTAGLGFVFKVLGFDLKTLQETIKSEFNKKPEILKLNLLAVQKGYDLGQTKYPKLPVLKNKILNFSGNEALVEGMLKAKCDFAAIYPMTPINSILTILSGSDTVEVFRPEDEVAGIMTAMGASYAGKRAMIATSGGGFALMAEGLGMAGMAEIPLVCVVGQRTGPSTGMATFSSQADLNFVINAGQGEFPRIVLAPGDVEECFRLGAEAFSLAEEYKVPVILLTDKYLAENRFSTKNLGEFNFKNFARKLPGEAIVRVNSYEHDEIGFSSDDLVNREKNMEQRMTKLAKLKEGFEVFGQGKKVIVGWGSTKTIILDFLKDTLSYSFVHVWRPWPCPSELTTFLKDFEDITVIEGNYSGQLADIIEKQIHKKVKRILKDNGRPFYQSDLQEGLK